MPKLNNRVIIDTNIWISFLLTKDFLRLDRIIADQKITLVFSEELIEEFIEVTQRRKFKKYFAEDDVENLLLKIRNRALFVNVTSICSACRDPKDNFLLSLALDGKASHLITGDKDLLILGKYGKTVILNITDYLNQIPLI